MPLFAQFLLVRVEAPDFSPAKSHALSAALATATGAKARFFASSFGAAKAVLFHRSLLYYLRLTTPCRGSYGPR
jgi:hypothetical protein